MIVDIEVLTSFRGVEGEDDWETGDRLTGDVEGEDQSETRGRLTRANFEGTGDPPVKETVEQVDEEAGIMTLRGTNRARSWTELGQL